MFTSGGGPGTPAATPLTVAGFNHRRRQSPAAPAGAKGVAAPRPAALTCAFTRFMPVPAFLRAAGTVAAWSVLCPPAGPLRAAPDDDAAAQFLTPRAVLWLGRTAAIPLRVPAPAGPEQLLCVMVDNPTVVEVLRAPIILPGEELGFARVRALRPGRARLRTLDGATLNVEVRRDPAAGVVAEAEGSRPRVVSPGAGAVVWGTVSVGVEMLDAPPAGSLGIAPAPRPRLRLPDGRQLDPVADTAPDLGPVRRWTFRVDADSLPVGPARLLAVAAPGGDGEPRTAPEGGALTVHVVRRPEPLAAGPCAASIAGSDGPQDLAPVRPARFGTRRPNVVHGDPGADSPRVLQCASEDPAWCLPVVVPAAGGRYAMMLRARGDAAAGALPTVGLYVNDAPAPLRVARLAESGWHRLPVGAPFKLDAGPAVVTVRFMNDFNVGQEDRNAYFDRFELVRVPDNVAPTVPAAADTLAANAPAREPVPLTAGIADARPQVLYPANGQTLWEADAVVARVAAPVAWADVVVDGQPLNVRLEHPPADRPLVFPLPLRGFTGSNRHLSVRVADLRGNVSDAPFRFVHFLDGPPPVPGPYARALRLLDRLAYGPEPRELAAVLTEGEAPWLDRRLHAAPNPAADESNLARAAARYPGLDDNNQAVHRALAQNLGDDNPVRARFTLWAENHFTTWVSKVGAALKWHEHARFARAGIAPFPSLLDLSARSPAMLVYLDQEKSYAGKINENYAREIMELHTLGVHGGYAQADVTALANVLNGWTLADEARLPAPGEEGMTPGNNNKEAGLEKGFRYDPFLNDGKPRRVFGLDFDAAPDRAARYDRVRAALEVLAAHPATAEHVCRKFVGHYVGTPANEGLVRDLSRVFLENGGDLRAVLRALAAHPAFWETPPRLANPQDYGLRLTRVLRGLLDLRLVADKDVSPKPDQLEGFFRRSGMGLFDRVTPDGYPEFDAAYADSNAMLQRWRFAQSLSGDLARLVPATWRQPVQPEVASTLPAVDPGQRLLDLAAMRLTGRPLGPASNAAAREVLGDNPKPDAVTPAIVFVSLLPEANLR